MTISEINRRVIKIIDQNRGVAEFMPLGEFHSKLPLEPQVKARLEAIAKINGGVDNVMLASSKEVRTIKATIKAAIAIKNRYVIHLSFPLKPGSTDIDDTVEPEAIEVDVHSSAVF